MSAEVWHAPMEMIVSRPSSKLHRVNNPAASQWVEKLTAVQCKMTNRWKEVAAIQRTYADKQMQPKEYAVMDNV